jgi:hypothetical protein
MHRHIFRVVSPRRGIFISGTCQRIFIRNHFATLTPAYRPSSKPTALPARSSAAGQRTPELKQLFQREAPTWINKVGVKHRLLRFGIPQGELPGLLAAFTRDVENGKALHFRKQNSTQLARLSQDMSPASRRQAIDQALTSIFYTWATDPRHQKTVESVVSKGTLDRMVRIRTAVDFTRIADSYPVARRMRRKLVLHVGPTNSGKTHTALRTLAAARVGAYGGPLRLLAHEIYQRLNTGQIVPLGAEAAETYEVDETSNFDVQVPGTPRAVLKHGNALFARPCSLLTGDERRVVDGATLYSCTVEMLSLEKRYEVVVIDEIQMIADSQRGHAWTAAVLGTAADELHMCGEERAVPIIEALAEITGDELIINRYERLSPLAVAPKSLERDLGRIRKGDCVVTFSRVNIFNLKREIEEKTGLKCAVVYGRLPPEIRAEQAARFNDPKSGIDVLVASDAIGMGLNLYVHAHSYYILQVLISSPKQDPTYRLRDYEQMGRLDGVSPSSFAGQTDRRSCRPFRDGRRGRSSYNTRVVRSPTSQSRNGHAAGIPTPRARRLLLTHAQRPLRSTPTRLNRDDRARRIDLLLGPAAKYGRDGPDRERRRDDAVYRRVQPGPRHCGTRVAFAMPVPRHGRQVQGGSL